MAVMQSKPPPKSQPRANEALERVYVYWIASVLVLLLIAVLAVAYARGALRSKEAALHELEGRLAALQQEVEALRPAPRAASQPATRPATPRPAGPPANAVPPRQPSGTPPAPPVAPGPQPPESPPPEAALRAQLDRIMGDEPTTPADVSDLRAAAALLGSVTQQSENPPWSGRTWARLAVLARLVGQDGVADDLARRAAALGDDARDFRIVSVRALLARQRAVEALPIAQRLVELGAPSATAQTLLAASLLEAGQCAAADETLARIQDLGKLSTYDTLLLARSFMALERWPRLEWALTAIGGVPANQMREYSFLQAAVLARTGRAVEALAILDFLAAQPPPEPSGPGAVWPPLAPGRYAIDVWRGVALLRADRVDSARETLLQAARSDPGRPEAHYYLGILEIRAGQRERAKTYLQNAIAAAPRMAPAWEAQALIELESGDLGTAIDHLKEALALNERRASSYFLLAIAQARRTDREAAAAALRAAFALDDAYLEEAKQADILTRLFTPRELEDLALPTTTEEAAPASAPA